MKKRVEKLLQRVSLSCLGVPFNILVEYDKKYAGLSIIRARVFIQIEYSSKCSKTNEIDSWKGRKYYLSEFMTDDEIVKTTYAAFCAAVQHEVMEGFKIDGKILFNPHVNFEELLKISDKEIKRQQYVETRQSI